MGERERQLDRDTDDLGLSVDALDESAGRRSQRTSETEATQDRTGGLRSRAASLFSLRAFLATTVLALVGFLAVGGLLPLGGIANLLGIATGTFLAGVAGSSSRYVESAVAGGVIGGGAAVLDFLALTLVGVGAPLLALGAVGGLLAGVVGHYFGRDLRDGLTREL